MSEGWSAPALEGQSWDVWLDNIYVNSSSPSISSLSLTSNRPIDSPSKDTEQSRAHRKHHRRFATLPHAKAPCYGSVPVIDDFLVVQCDLCGLRVKPLSFQHHMSSRHNGKTSPLCLLGEESLLPTSEYNSLLDSFLLSPVMQSICTTGEASPPHADTPENKAHVSNNIFDQFPTPIAQSDSKNSGSRSSSQTPSSIRKDKQTTPTSVSSKKSQGAKLKPPTARKSVQSINSVVSKQKEIDNADYQVLPSAPSTSLKLTISKKSCAKPTIDIGPKKPQITNHVVNTTKPVDRGNKRKQTHLLSPAKSEVKIVGVKAESIEKREHSPGNLDAPPRLTRQAPIRKLDTTLIPVKNTQPSTTWETQAMQEHPKPVATCRFGMTRHMRIVNGRHSFFYAIAQRSVQQVRLKFKMSLDTSAQPSKSNSFLPTYDCDNKPTVSQRRLRKLASKASSPGLDSLPDLQLAINSMSSTSPMLKDEIIEESDGANEWKTPSLRRLLGSDPRSQAVRPMKRPAPRAPSIIHPDRNAQQFSPSHYPTINLNRVAQMQKSSSTHAVRLSDIAENRSTMAYASQPPSLVQMQPSPQHISPVPSCHVVSPSTSISHSYAKSPPEHNTNQYHQRTQHNMNNKSWSNNAPSVLYIESDQLQHQRMAPKRPLASPSVSRVKRRKSSLTGGSTHVPSNQGYVIEQIEQTSFMANNSMGTQGSWHKLGTRAPQAVHRPQQPPAIPIGTPTMVLDAQTGKIYSNGMSPHAMGVGVKAPNGVMLRKGGSGPYQSPPLVRLSPPRTHDNKQGGPPTLQPYPRGSAIR